MRRRIYYAHPMSILIPYSKPIVGTGLFPPGGGQVYPRKGHAALPDWHKTWRGKLGRSDLNRLETVIVLLLAEETCTVHRLVITKILYFSPILFFLLLCALVDQSVRTFKVRFSNTWLHKHAKRHSAKGKIWKISYSSIFFSFFLFMCVDRSVSQSP